MVTDTLVFHVVNVCALYYMHVNSLHTSQKRISVEWVVVAPVPGVSSHVTTESLQGQVRESSQLLWLGVIPAAMAGSHPSCYGWEGAVPPC